MSTSLILLLALLSAKTPEEVSYETMYTNHVYETQVEIPEYKVLNISYNK